MICKFCGQKMSCVDSRSQQEHDWGAPRRRWVCEGCQVKAITTETVLTVQRVRVAVVDGESKMKNAY